MQGLPFQRSENHHLQGARKKVSLDRFFHAGRFFSCFADHAAQGLEQTSMVRADSQVKNQERNFETAFAVSNRNFWKDRGQNRRCSFRSRLPEVA
jgi:hypothetical protein